MGESERLNDEEPVYSSHSTESKALQLKSHT